MLWYFWAPLVLISLVLLRVFVIDGLVGHLSYSATPSFISLKYTGSAKIADDIAVVYFDSILIDPEDHVLRIARALQDNGPTYIVKPPPHRFNRRHTIKWVYRQLWDMGIRRVTVAGNSFGANLAADFTDYNRRLPADRKIQVRQILQAPPAGRRTMHDGKIALLTLLLYPGPLLNLLSSTFWRLAYVGHTQAQLEDGVSMEEATRLEQSGRHARLSRWAAEIRYMVRRSKPSRWQYPEPTVLIQCDGKGTDRPEIDDGQVRHITFDIWRRAIKQLVAFLIVKSAHCDFIGSPRANEQVYREAFDAHGPWLEAA